MQKRLEKEKDPSFTSIKEKVVESNEKRAVLEKFKGYDDFIKYFRSELEKVQNLRDNNQIEEASRLNSKLLKEMQAFKEAYPKGRYK